MRDLEIALELGKRVEEVKRKYADIDFRDAFSEGQIKSKLWLIEKLEEYVTELGIVFVLGGWIGLLPFLLLNDGKLNIEKLRSLDIDPKVNEVAREINRQNFLSSWKFYPVSCDVTKIEFNPFVWYGWSTVRQESVGPIKETPGTIINTSCEHMNDNWFNEIPYGKLVVLQSNNFLEGEGHVNCVQSLEEMKSKYKLTELLYSGSLELDKYTRFMLIGYK